MVKKWWTSKLIWAGVVTALIAGYNSINAQFGLPAIPEFVYALLGAFGVYNRVTSTGFVNKVN